MPLISGPNPQRLQLTATTCYPGEDSASFEAEGLVEDTVSPIE